VQDLAPRRVGLARLTPRSGDLLRRLADVGANGSFSNARRSRRFESFARLVERLLERDVRTVRILDIGGTNSFWEQRGWAGRDDIRIVMVNIDVEPARHENIEPCGGDATNLSDFPAMRSMSCSAIP
jgi:hypothetical protein